MDRRLHDCMMAQYATPEVSGDGRAEWNDGVKCVIPSVKLYGAVVQDGTPIPDAPIMPVCNDGIYRITNADDTWDGGTATAPELWAIPGTNIRDEWDAQTGWGVRRVKKLVLDGTENWLKNKDFGDYKSFFIEKSKYDLLYRNYPGICQCFQTREWAPLGGEYFWYATASIGFRIHKSRLGDNYDDLTTNAERINSFRAWLAAQSDADTPVTIWYALAKPKPFYYPPARLTMPPGYGQIIQVLGSVPDCPVKAKYLTHAGGAK